MKLSLNIFEVFVIAYPILILFYHWANFRGWKSGWEDRGNMDEPFQETLLAILKEKQASETNKPDRIEGDEWKDSE